MGPFPIYRHKTPLLVSGKGAAFFTEKMAPFGMDITLMDQPVGSASATKMFRSIFMKGFIAQSLEMLFAARKYQVEDVVLRSVQESFTVKPFLEVVNVLLTRAVIHSERREHEMEEVIDTLKNLNVDSTMSQATRAKMKWVTDLGLREYFKGVPPKDFHEIFSTLE
jgi:3-hydroxyisobutyrate dehydrogenase-like beta-hydroxyacid dehydrogenase